ncbi:MAG: hypothetical protein ACOZAN_03840 [Patescibacteria group bacterium]
MELLKELVQKAFAVDSVWSVVLRGLIWLAVAIIIMVSADNPNAEGSLKSLKSNLGFFLMFIVVTSTLIYLLFGFTKTSA